MSYLNLMTAHEDKDGRTYWTKCGVMFQPKEGDKHAGRIVLHALPVNGELVAFAPKSTPADEA